MRKILILAGIILVSASSFAQKKELKKAQRAYKGNDIAEALTYINQAEGMIGSADDAMKADFYLLKGQIYLADAGKNDFEKMKGSAEAFKKALEMNPTSKEATTGVQQLRASLVNSAVSDQRAKNFASATKKLYTSYTVAKDTLDLYNAAESSVLAKDYDTALPYFEQLLDMGYTGIKKEWIATDVETGEIVTFADESTRTTNMLSGKYTNPDERMANSVQGDILRSVAIIYTSKGEKDKAMAMMKKARAANPNDMGLMRAEADMVYKMGDMAAYNKIMEEIIASDPNNPELYYNLGVGSAKNGNPDKAIEYYKKALKLKPDYAAAQINIAATMLGKEGAIVEEMNGLGMSKADNARYDVLKQQRKDLYTEVIPYLESAMKLRSDNIELVRTLMNIYDQVGNDAKSKEMKAKLQAMEGGQ